LAPVPQGVKRGINNGWLRVGVEQRMFELSPHTGHGRVWTATLSRLNSYVELVVGDPRPDVWLIDGHNGDIGQTGPKVSCVYEVGWGRPDLDRDHDPDFVQRMSEGTRAAIASSNRIVTPSMSSCRDVISTYRVDPSLVDVVPLGVDSSVFRKFREVDAKSSPLSLPADRPYILFASSLHPRKNLSVVREAVRQLADLGFPHLLVIVSEPFPDRPDAEDRQSEAFGDLAGHPGRVVRVASPSDADLAVLMSNATALCQPSRHEGFGLTVLEAMATGTPVVVSRRASLPEVVGRCGWVVEPSPEDVRRALVEIISQPARSRVKAALGLRRAHKMSWERTAAGWSRSLQLAAES
jgi:glycosyltransferase involved in cell wall biosynthesis